MLKRFENAFADWPKTTVLADGGVHVSGRYVGPYLYRAGTPLAFLAAMGIAIILSVAQGDIRPGFWFMLAFGIAWFVFLRSLVNFIFGKNVNVRIYADRIKVLGLLGYRTYSRAMPIEFRIDPHHRALKERGHRTLYRRAIEVVMQYGEKRVPLAEMPQENIELARALVIRLQNVCASVDLCAEAGIQDARALRESEFGPAPDVR